MIARKALLALCVLLASVPLAWGSAGSPRYAIDLRVDFSRGTFTGTEAVTYTNTTSTNLYELFFRLYPNAHAIYGDGTLTVDVVRVGDAPVSPTGFGDETILFVPLSSPLAPGGVVTVDLSFHGRLTDWRRHPGGTGASDYGIYASSSSSMTMAECYPILAPYDEEMGWDLDSVSPIGDAVTSGTADYVVTVTAAADLTVLTSGIQVGEEPLGSERRCSFVGDDIRDFMIVVVKDYETRSELKDGLTVRTSFLPEHAQAAETSSSLARRALSLYGELFGPYFGTELDLVEVPLSRAAGVEYPGLILIGESYCENPYDQFFTIIIAHEVAHQWWYAVVGNNVTEEPWLDEALATYTSLVFIEREWGEESADSFLATWRERYRRARLDHPELSVTSPVYLFPDSSVYSAFVYYGGAVLLDEIRRRIGDDAFFSALSEYYRDLAGRIAHRADLLSRFEEACVCGLGELFARYFTSSRSSLH